MPLTTLDIKEPGLNVLPPGVERYIVEGGGLTGIQVLPDDEIEIINNEGNQICEISAFNKDKRYSLCINSYLPNANCSSCDWNTRWWNNKPLSAQWYGIDNSWGICK